MRKIGKFLAMQGIGHLGWVGACLALLGGDAWGQMPVESDASAYSEDVSSEKTVYLKFFNADWPTILNKVAEESGSTLVMHEIPPGRLTRRDKTPYTRHEVVQILNHELEPEGFRILEKNQFLIVIHQRAVRTRYRRPERPTQPEWQPDASVNRNFDEFSGYKRSVTPIATRDQLSDKLQPPTPAPIQLASDAKPVPAPAPMVQHTPTVPGTATNPLVAPQPQAAISAGLPAGWSQTTLNPRNNVRDLAGTLYKAVNERAELLDAGINGLPSFRMSFPASAENAAPGGYEVGIDLQKNQIVMASTPDRLRQLATLFQIMDRDTNAFQSPIRLMAADDATAKLAQQLNPQLNRIAREAAKQNVQPADGRVGGAAKGELPPNWALAQAQPNPNQPQPQPNPNQPNQGTQVVPVQPPAGLQAVIANFRGDVQIQAIPELGIMILKGNQADVDALISIIKQIQEQTKGVTPDVDLLLLENLNSTALAELLQSVYEQLATISTRTGQPQQRVAFIPIVRPNALMILAPQVEIDSIRKLAIQLDQPIDPTANIEVFYLKHATATQAAATLTAAFQAQTTQAAPGGGAAGATAVGAALQPRIQVVPDVRTNSLIVQARPNDMREVALIISKIDLNYSPAVNKMQVVPLKNAVADELANVITSTLLSLINPATVTGTPPAGQVNNQIGGQGGQAPQELRDTKSMILEFLSSVGDQDQIVRSGLLLDVRVTPDIRSNSLIVTAPEQSMEMIVALIQRLDQPSATVAEIKVFTLENADAAAMLELLLTLFEQDDTAAAPGVQIVGAEDASSGLVPLRFSVDVRTNSIIAIGGGDALRVVEAILLRLDESDVRERKTTVVKLRNSPATEIAAAINTFLQSQRDLATIDPELVSNTELLEREIIAVAEPVSNSLLISATPRYYEEVQALIRKLDAEPPQVIIQALLVEVALDNTDEFGVELGFQDDILFDRSITGTEDLTLIDQTFTNPNGVQTTTQQIVSQTAVPGFRFNDPTFSSVLPNNINAAPSLVGSQSLSNFSLGRVNNELGFGGLVLSASSNQVSFLLRALAARRQVHILSRPQIRTLDNQVAQIQVGQQVPIVNGITFGGANNAAYPIVVQDSAGIILTVTPRISPEENIVMEVVAEKSAFTGAGVTIFVDSTTGNEITSPIKDITTARTTVGVPNGQTIVLGGMITKNDETIERKVPWLADLPYLGLPFRYDSTRTRRTELLIFLTPRIIRGDADNELIKQVESERMHFIEQEAEEIHGPIFEVPGAPGMQGWMEGADFCPPGTPGAPSWEGAPGGMEMTVPPAGNPIPAPAPAAPPNGPALPHMPPIPDKNMSWRQIEPKPPGSLPPSGGVVKTSASGSPSGGVQHAAATQRPKSDKKRPWYAFGKK